MTKHGLLLLSILVVVLAACGRGDVSTPTRLAPTQVSAAPTTIPVEAATAESTAEATVGAESTEAADAAVPGGDAEAGRVVFNTPKPVGGATWMCAQCHPVTEQPAFLIGPTLWNISENAAMRVEGQTATEYIRNSILHPNDVIAPGVPGMETFPSNLMPQDYEQHLTEDELTNLVAYLFSLK
jgi:cytochrome c2